MKKLVRIEIMVSGTDSEIREVLTEIYEISRRKEIVSMTSQTLDMFRGCWTGESVIKTCNKVIGLPIGFRKASIQKE